mmetsp:Transcript_128262/g.362973  ORF Transcript_128262/g.362973 Transcript_128262/m.362973 type:complete len:250 (+) Transcript_128262:171-920(+)
MAMKPPRRDMSIADTLSSGVRSLGQFSKTVAVVACTNFIASRFRLEHATRSSPSWWKRSPVTAVVRFPMLWVGSFGMAGPLTSKRSRLPVPVPTARSGAGEFLVALESARVLILVAHGSFVFCRHRPVPRSHSYRLHSASAVKSASRSCEKQAATPGALIRSVRTTCLVGTSQIRTFPASPITLYMWDECRPGWSAGLGPTVSEWYLLCSCAVTGMTGKDSPVRTSRPHILGDLLVMRTWSPLGVNDAP